MKAFTVLVNGQKVATLGIGDSGVLSAIVNWVDGRSRGEEDEFFMQIGGLDCASAEHVRWPAPPLAVGDEVTIRLLEVEQVDPPAERTPRLPPTSDAHRGIRDRVAHSLSVWRDHRPEPWGQVLSAEASVRFQCDADTDVGADVVYAPAGATARQAGDTTLIDAVPALAVQIPSSGDTMGEIHEKVDRCLAAGVGLVWVINPRRRTVTIYRPDAEPEMANVLQQLSGEPHLPGFRVPVAQLFA